MPALVPLPFYEPESGSFGGLGHPICDADTGDILPFGSGEAAAVTIFTGDQRRFRLCRHAAGQLFR